MKSKIKYFSAIITIIITAAGCVVHTRPPVPAVRVEVKPARPHAQAVWIAGHWKWNRWRHRYVWVPGHWNVKKGRRGKRVIIH